MLLNLTQLEVELTREILQSFNEDVEVCLKKSFKENDIDMISCYSSTMIQNKDIILKLNKISKKGGK